MEIILSKRTVNIQVTINKVQLNLHMINKTLSSSTISNNQGFENRLRALSKVFDDGIVPVKL